jgi:Protein tyrosine and serine/threonine kinase
VEGQAIQPGSILAGRYRIDDLVGEAAGSTTWRAFDQILNRSVSIRAVASDDPRRAAFLEAARRSTAVSDPRFLPVLDAVPDEDGIAYVVREWSRGLPLSVILREGPLPSQRAATIVAEVAEALAYAHEAGMPHRGINPSTVLVKDNGAVRITGLGTEYALRAAAPAPAPDATDEPADDAAARHAGEQVDVRAIGRVFYACLVARWPGGRGFGLPPAPTEHGRLLRPRQVRAGVSREADRICDRILGQPPRHHATPLTNPREIADLLSQVTDDDSMLDDDTEITLGEIGLLPVAAGNGDPNGPPPALLPTRPRPVPPPRELTRLERSREMARHATEGHRKLIWLGTVLLIVIAALVSYVVGRETAEPPASASGADTRDSQAGATDVEPLKIDAITTLDPPPDGNGEENDEDVGFAYDKDPTTAWETKSYYTYPDFGHLKDGVGLVVDLGSDKEVTGVEIRFGTAPTSYRLFATTPDASSYPSEIPSATDEWKPFGEREKATVPTATPRIPAIRTQYVMLWLTKVPPDGDGTYTGIVNEITVEGPAT